MNTVTKPELITYDSVLAAITGFDESDALTEDSHISVEGCYRAFGKLVKEFPKGFPDLFFQDRSGIPYSTELEDILFQLGAWRQIEENNPDYLNFTVTKDKKKLIRREIKRNYQNEKEIIQGLKKISKRFRDLLKER